MQLIDRTDIITIKDVATPVRVVIWDYIEEIARGASFLDATVGKDWHNDLDLEELDLHSGYSCVLGQLAMTRFREQLIERGGSVGSDCDDDCAECNGSQRYEYADVTRLLAEETEDSNWQYHSSGNPATHGFFVDEDKVTELLEGYSEREQEWIGNLAWEHLTHGWMDEIRVRREAEKKAAQVHKEADEMLAEERRREQEFARELEAVPA